MKIRISKIEASKALPAKEIREWAQDEILYAAGAAFYSLNDSHVSNTEKDIREKALQVQYKRIQKMFGYSPTGFVS